VFDPRFPILHQPLQSRYWFCFGVLGPVANIDRIPRHAGFYVMILPLRFQGLTGWPVRALALWTDEE
jgi:kynurenine formamidase